MNASIQTLPAAMNPDGPLIVGEGTAITASATASGPTPYSFDWSLTKGMTTIQTGDDPTFAFTPPDEVNLVIHLTLQDADDKRSSDSLEVIVTNVAPVVSLDAIAPIFETESLSISGTYADPGILDSQTLTVDWGDLNNLTHSTFAIPALKNAGGMVTLSAGDTFSSTTDLAKLTITSIDATTGKVGFLVEQHQYLDDGPAPGNGTTSDTSLVTVTVLDEDGDSGSDTAMATVNNVGPTLSLDAVDDIDENGLATLTGTYTELSPLDSHTLTIDWDDPNNITDSVFVIPALKNTAGMTTLSAGDTISSSTDLAVLTITSVNAATGQVGFSVKHQYFDDGLAPGNGTTNDKSIIKATITDDDTGSDSKTAELIVHNKAPLLVLNPVDDVDENGTATLTGTYSDISVLDGHTLVVDWDDPNNIADSTFTIPAMKNPSGMVTLSVGDMFVSSTDLAVLTITSVNAATGQVGFRVQHRYLDDGAAPGNNTASDGSQISVTLTDDDAGTTDATTPVIVHNVAPSVKVDALADIVENGVVTVTGTYTEVGILDGHMLVVDWDDPNNLTDSTFTIPARKSPSGMITLSVGDVFSSSSDLAVLKITSINEETGEIGFSVAQHQYLDDGLAPGNNTASDVSVVRVTVTDDDGQSGSGTATLTVHNAAPAPVLDPVADIDEGGSVTLTGRFTDAGILDHHQLRVDWGNPNNPTDSLFTIPALKSPSGMVTLSAGDVFSSSTDSAVLTITSANAATGEIGFSIHFHQYLDDGLAPGNNTASDLSTISLTVDDDDAQSGNTTTAVTVHNVPPTVVLNAVPDINENGLATLTGTYTDAGVLDTHTLVVDWDDPNNIADSTFEIPGRKNSAGMTTLTVGMMIDSSTDLAKLLITSVNAVTGEIGFSVQHQYLDDGLAPGNNTANDKSTIRVTLTDDDTGSDVATTMLTVHNVAPVVTLAALPDINENGVATLTGSFTDIGILEHHTLTVDWDDPNNSVDSVFALPAMKNSDGMITLAVGDKFMSADGAELTITSLDPVTGVVGFSVQHRYLDDGLAPGNATPFDVSTIRVTVADDDMGSDTATTTLKVNNVPPTLVVSVGDINENGIATLTGTYTDIGLLDFHSITIDWDDPNNALDSTFVGISAIRDANGTPILGVNDLFVSFLDGAVLKIDSIDATTGQVTFTVQRRYFDDGLAPGNNTPSDTSSIKVTLTDDDDATVMTTALLTVHNVPPVVVLDAVPDISENGVATLTGRFTDIGLLDGHTVTVDWDDPNHSADSVFMIPAMINSSGVVVLTVGSTFDSADGATLTITSVDADTGTVGFSVQHRYLDDGVAPGNGTAFDTSTITVTVADDDTASVTKTTTVTVNNVSPVVVLNQVPDIDENGVATLTGTFTDIGMLDGHTLTVDWNDPNNGADSIFIIPALKDSSGMVNLAVGSTFDSADGAQLTIASIDDATGEIGFSIQHRYRDDGVAPGNGTASDTSTITVTVADDDTASDMKTTTVTVNNVSPVVVLNQVPDIDENGVATLTGTFTDIGLLDGHTLTVDWDDPNNSTNSHFVIPSIRNADDVVTLHVGDMFVSSSDDAVLIITSVDVETGTVGFSVQHRYLDDGLAPGNGTASDTSTIGVTVADDDTASDTKTTTVTINNVSPIVVLNQVPDIDENGVATLTGTFTDIGLLDGHTLTVDWDDPNNSANSHFVIPSIRNADDVVTLHVGDTFASSSDDAVLTITAVDVETGTVGFSVQHRYLDDGLAPGNGTAFDTSTIGVTVADDDTASGSHTTLVRVFNVSPSLVLHPVADINENGVATLTGTFTDIGLLDRHSITIDWDDPNNAANSTFNLINSIRNAAGALTLAVGDTFSSSTNGAVLTITSVDAATGQIGFSVQHQYLDDGPAPGNNTSSDTSTIQVIVTDDDTGTDTKSATVTIHNVAPVTVLSAIPEINENGIATLTGTFTDIGLLDGHTLTVDWDDPNNSANSSFVIPAIRNAAGAATLSVGDTFSSSSDGAVLTITSIDATTGRVGFSVQHQYLDDGPAPGNGTAFDTSTIGVTVADDDTASGSDTEVLTVRNVMPVFINTLGTTIDENSAATIAATILDAGSLDVFSVAVNWQDGSTATIVGLGLSDIAAATVGSTSYSWNAATRRLTLTHHFGDDNPTGTLSDEFPVSLLVTDDDTGTGGTSIIVTVKNVAPTITAVNVGPLTINESESVSLSGSFTDRAISFSTETFKAFVIWGDGQSESLTVSVNGLQGALANLSHTYRDNDVDNKFTILVRVADDDMGAFHDASKFLSGVVGRDFSEAAVEITVLNVNPTLQPIAATDVNSLGFTTLKLTFSDPGSVTESFTILVDWGDSQEQFRAERGYDGATPASFVLTHRYTGPPDPFNPTAPIVIRVVIHDDDFGTGALAIGESNVETTRISLPGTQTFMTAIDTTPQVPPLEFIPPPMTEVFLGQFSNTVQSLQSQETRVARSDQNPTSEIYFELRIVFPDGQESEEGYRLPDDALERLREIFASLPDNRYRIYQVRTETDSRRLVMEVDVRRGRVVDTSDESEGTRDRPPTGERLEHPAPLDQNPLLQPLPNQGQNEVVPPPAAGTATGAEPTSPEQQAPETAPATAPPNSDPPPPSRFGRMSRFSVPLVGFGLTAGAAGWSKQLDAALHVADRRAWQRLRRAGRLGRSQRSPNSSIPLKSPSDQSTIGVARNG